MIRRPGTLTVAVAVLSLVINKSSSEFYDVIQPHLIPPPGGCKDWSELPDQDKHWRGNSTARSTGAPNATRELARAASRNIRVQFRESKRRDEGPVFFFNRLRRGPHGLPVVVLGRGEALVPDRGLGHPGYRRLEGALRCGLCA